VPRTKDPRYQRMLDRLRKAREAAGLTQHAASLALGRYPTFVNKIETGERRIDPVELVDLARLYGRALDDFVP